ncbi:MAG: hypothetical protein Kow0037_24130 [Calditrichia bacterium]
MEPNNIRYKIDRNNILFDIEGAWEEFATKNGAKNGLFRNEVLGKNLLDFITGEETRYLYEVIFTRLRSHPRTVVLPFRCDAPDRRRFLELTITPIGNGGLQLASRLLREEMREEIRFLRGDIPRSEEVLPICSVCKKIRVSPNEWLEAEEAVVHLRIFEKEVQPRLSHGLCPSCYRQAMDSLGVK